MKIVGLQKLTLLDFPGHVACTVFLGGCNFSCPFCYNSSLLSDAQDNLINEDDFYAFLDKRKGKIDGVAITGGEPLLNNNIEAFIKKIKDKGFKVKLDTNGSFPEVLQTLIEKRLVDYVAMDIKNTFEKYPSTTNCKTLNIEKIKQSIAILLKGDVDYEFRTTVVKQFHDIEDFKIIGENIKGAKNYFIQCFINKDSCIDNSLSPLTKNELQSIVEVVKPYVNNVSLRGVD